MTARWRGGAARIPLLLLLALAGCDTWGHFQRPPPMTAPGEADEIPVTAVNAPAIVAGNGFPVGFAQQGSLWRPGAKAFFRDPRARMVGDLLTVAVDLKDQGEFADATTLQRNSNDGMTVGSLFGLGSLLGHIIPGMKSADATVNTTGAVGLTGQGNIKRNETLHINVAATVLRVLPNSNFEIAGSQQIRLNNELRELQIRGIIRPEDIRADNTIVSEKIAEARITYGGRGVSSDLQRAPWGQDLLTRIQPF